tara:strand:+ start:4275 stop:5258 length:984 start_codon:yes stop_codon:yes gene_type:complete
MDIKKIIKWQLSKINNFEKLCRVNNITISHTYKRNDLSEDEIILEYLNDINSKLILYLSNDIKEFSINYFRLLDCLKVWIPCMKNCSERKNKNLKIKLNISDRGDIDTYSMDSCNTNKLIPDQFSMFDHYENKYEINLLSNQKFIKQWMLKKNILFWRGSTTGQLIKGSQDMSQLKRIKYCLNYQQINGFDLKISKVTQTDLQESLVIKWLKEKKIYSKPVDEDYFSNYKYYPDIPGNALAWGTIRKFRAGSLVFRTKTKRSLYYYRLMKEWKHYIPLENDLNDIKNKYLWAETNQYEAAQIAYNGYKVANKYIQNIPDHFAKCINQ